VVGESGALYDDSQGNTKWKPFEMVLNNKVWFNGKLFSAGKRLH